MSDMTPLLNKKLTVIIGVIGLAGAAYTVWRIVDKVLNPNRGTAFEGTGAIGTLGNATNKVLGGAPAAVGGAIADKLYDWFGDEPDPRDDTFYTVQFMPGLPDGQKHSIPAKSVAANGTFYYLSKLYKIRVDADGKKHATPQ